MLSSLLRLSIAALFISIGSMTYAQKWEKTFTKLDEKYQVGDYASAKKGIEKAEKKIKKKLGTDSPIYVNALIRKARYSNGLGLLNQVEPSIDQAMEISEKVNADNASEYGFTLKEAAKVLVDYGNYQKANELVKTSRSVLSESGNLIEEIEAELDVLDAQILSGKGFYRQAIALVDQRLEFFQGRVAAAGKKDEKSREDLAQLLIAKANSLRNMGDYLRADSAFLYNENWISDELKRTHILYAENQFLNTKLLEENGLAVDAQASRYEDIYLKATRRYVNSHKTIMKVRESLMKAYFENGNGQRLKLLQSEFKKTLAKGFPKESVYNLSDDLIQLNYRLMDANLSTIETSVNKLLGYSSIPEKHAYRIELLEFATEIGLLQGAHKNTETYLGGVLEIKEHLYGPETPNYHMTKIQLANYYVDYSDKFDEAEEIYERSYNEIVKPEIHEGHVQYLNILNHLASYYQETDQYDRASETLGEALLNARKKYDNKDIAYGLELEQIASLQIKIGQYENASDNLKEAISIFRALKTDQSFTATGQALITEASLLGIKGEYDEAEANINEAERQFEKGVLRTSFGLDTEQKLAALYLKLGRLAEAELLLGETIRSKQNQFGNNSRHLNEPLIIQSELHLTKGNYAEAENAARRANTLSRDIFGEESTKVVPSMLRLADVYNTIGDFDKSESLVTNAITIQKSQFGAEHVDVAKSTATLALIKFLKNKPTEEVESLFSEAQKTIGAKLGTSSPAYAEVLKNIAIVNISSGQYNQAFTYLDDAGRIWKDKIGRRNNINAATVNVLKGDIFYRQKRYARAEKYYEDASKQFRKFFSENHPEYVKVQSKLSKTYFMQGNWSKAQDRMEEVLANYEAFIAKYFPALSEREKAKFWNTIKPDYEFYNSLIISKNRKPKYVGQLFNNALLTKALLLNSSIKIRQRINNSDDEELKSLYGKWIDKKELLTAALSMSAQQLEENNINPSSLTNEVELIEKELSVKSEIFGLEVDAKPVTWEDVQGSLKENEVAMEMVRFRVFDHTFGDSIVYAMLYISGEKNAKPSAILLNNGDELESRYLKYYRNAIKFKLQDNFSYHQFWRPIVEELGTIATLYLSPDGVYNQINLEAIPTPDGKYVLDNSNIILLSNTKDLYKNRVTTRSVTEKQVAMMFGNPTFYVDTEPGLPVENSGITRATAEVVSPLPGTEKEVRELKQYLGDRGWEIDDYTENNATEPAIKAVSNPKIFHVATHGFFQDDQLQASALDQELRENAAYDNPLLKTGLLLTGAGDILNETKFNYNIDNGILTAYEAMNLNLDQTDLVVLSACETGLGELEAGEGVYGLQRAFLVAGAKTIIMSLFKVSDDATQQLMVKFYRKWLETGNKRQSFIDAKKEIRNEFRDPIYWGPFIMIGLE